MEMIEAFPAKFCKGIRAHWRRRKYQRLDGASGSKKRVVKLGGGQSTRRRRAWNLRSVLKIRVRLPSPVRLLKRLRDAYVDAMLSLAGKGGGLSAPAGAGSLWAKRIPKAKPARFETGTDFERRLILEIYKSISASGARLTADV